MTLELPLNDLRPRAFAIAYRMLGSVSEAEDIVQEALLRVHQAVTGGEVLESPAAFVTTVTTRLAITELQSARARRERYVGDWLPEPLITDADPSALVETNDALSMALLVTLEKLTPDQRAALLLHDVFDYGYEELAEVIGVSSANARQLVARARAHLGDDRDRFTATPDSHAELVTRFFAAAQNGDLDGLEQLLTEHVTLTGDGGGKVPALGRTILGRFRVAKTMVNGMREWMRYSPVTWREVSVNGGPGRVFEDSDGKVLGVIAITVVNGSIASIDAVVNPDKLTHLGPVGDLKSMQRPVPE
ncbi:MAG TPA: RNA polymerase sigma factor SigJ [Pseudolysinimonas sp.]|nr:RNA polymerase sigma factor SigJ [Pseudolysinimonas sp.]